MQYKSTLWAHLPHSCVWLYSRNQFQLANNDKKIIIITIFHLNHLDLKDLIYIPQQYFSKNSPCTVIILYPVVFWRFSYPQHQYIFPKPHIKIIFFCSNLLSHWGLFIYKSTAPLWIITAPYMHEFKTQNSLLWGLMPKKASRNGNDNSIPLTVLWPLYVEG